MNVDEAMAFLDKSGGYPEYEDWYEEVKPAIAAVVAEVERLRAELAQLRKDWCDDDEAIKQQALRVLDAAKVEGDSVYVPRMGALAEMMADELVKVHSELAAAKAASVVPEESAIWLLAVAAKLEKDGEASGLDSMTKAAKWLRDRMGNEDKN